MKEYNVILSLLSGYLVIIVLIQAYKYNVSNA